jgi:hypothetical protein
MRVPFIPMFAALIATVVLFAPASATTLSQAIKLCQKNPNCTSSRTKTGAVLCLKSGQGGCAHEIACTNKGGCIVASAKARSPGRVGPILTGTVLTAGEKQIAATMHGPRGHTSSTYQDGPRKVVRDHRGQPGNQSPTGNQTSTNPIVRDHRTGGGPTHAGGGSHR